MTITSTPNCPNCDKPMVERNSQRGPFYGCSQFPRCKGTRPMRKGTGGSASTSTTSRERANSILGSTATAAPKPKQTGFSFAPSKAVEGPPRSNRPSLRFGRAFSTPGARRIAFAAFNAHIADEIHDKISNPNPRLFNGTGQQQEIWTKLNSAFDSTILTPSHVAILAGPGTGKTSTLVQWFALARQDNRIIDVQATTYHSMGKAMINRACGGTVRINKWKVSDIIDGLSGIDKNHKEYRRLSKCLRSLTTACKNGLSHGDPGDIDTAIDFYNIEVPKGFEPQLYSWVPAILARCEQITDEVDFDDMLWLPVIKGWGLEEDGFDDLLCDEAQDTAPIQRHLNRLACPSGRIVIVGDENQAIYGFRGATLDALQLTADELASSIRSVQILPLTITQRCPKSAVELATRLFGRDKLQAVPEAPEGIVRCEHDINKAVAQMRPGDMVMCRINKPLIPTAYALLRRGVKALIRGKNFGEDLIAWVERMGAGSLHVEDLLTTAAEFYRKEAANLRALGVKGEHRLEALADRHDCLIELCRGLDQVSEVLAKITSLFSDERPENCVLLTTVHRGKGLESGRVWILAPELMPWPKAQGWQLEQEKNLLWVALTRVKWERDIRDGSADGELIFVGDIPKILTGGGDDNGDDDDEDYIDVKIADELPAPTALRQIEAREPTPAPVPADPEVNPETDTLADDEPAIDWDDLEHLDELNHLDDDGKYIDTEDKPQGDN